MRQHPLSTPAPAALDSGFTVGPDREWEAPIGPLTALTLTLQSSECAKDRRLEDVFGFALHRLVRMLELVRKRDSVLMQFRAYAP